MGMERFGDRLVISTAFQEGDVALIDMAYRIDPSVKIFSIDTGRLPTETFELIETLRERYPGLQLTLLSPDASQLQRLVDRHGPNLFYRSIEQRLLCCNVRKVQPLTKHLGGIDAWVTGLRRDQWAGRTDIRKVEIDHDHGAIVKLNPLAEWTEDEVWDYVRENDVPVHPLYAQGYTSIGCAPCTRPIAAGEPMRAGRWWWESGAPKECGMHCAIETGGFEHELHAILGKDAEAQCRTDVAVKPDEREVALSEVQAVLDAARDEGYRARLVSLADVGRAGRARPARRPRSSSACSSSASRPAGSARCTGPAASRLRCDSSGGCPPGPGSPRRHAPSRPRSRH